MCAICHSKPWCYVVSCHDYVGSGVGVVGRACSRHKNGVVRLRLLLWCVGAVPHAGVVVDARVSFKPGVWTGPVSD